MNTAMLFGVIIRINTLNYSIAFLKEYLDRRKYVMTTQIGIEIAPEISGCIPKNSIIKEIITRFKIKQFHRQSLFQTGSKTTQTGGLRI